MCIERSHCLHALHAFDTSDASSSIFQALPLPQGVSVQNDHVRRASAESVCIDVAFWVSAVDGAALLLWLYGSLMFTDKLESASSICGSYEDVATGQ